MVAADELELRSIGLRIAMRRQVLGISQMDLALACGISANTMSSIEAGRVDTKISILRKIATELRCSTDYLLFDNASTPIPLDRLDQLTGEARLTLPPKFLNAYIDQSQAHLKSLQSLM